ncbi:MAG: hypothetical protein J5523_02605 [Muribaculaceae bacterium]|nr:hypothetical protein [Muribaculaceae bacterium]
MKGRRTVSNAAELIDLIHELGFLPLLRSSLAGFSAEQMVTEECGYVVLPDGGWDWPMWKWKGSVITDGACAYGKFFEKKAGFIALEWWPHFMNWRRSMSGPVEEGSVEESILATLQFHGSLITRELRTACGFTGAKMRSRFDAYITRMQMQCRIVTEDFVYPRDRHNREYGWGWSLLTTPERLYGREACSCPHTPDESLEKMLNHLHQVLPAATDTQLLKFLT